jgi:hypothetical protein
MDMRSLNSRRRVVDGHDLKTALRQLTPETAVLIPVNDAEELFQGVYLCLWLVAVPTQILPHPENTPTTHCADERCPRNWCVVFN